MMVLQRSLIRAWPLAAARAAAALRGARDFGSDRAQGALGVACEKVAMGVAIEKIGRECATSNRRRKTKRDVDVEL
jgi:hypothetical protein